GSVRTPARTLVGDENVMNGIIPLGARCTTPRVTVVLPRLHVLDIPARFVAPSRSGRPPEEAPDREPLSGRQPRVPFPSPTELAPGATRVDAAPGLAPGPRLGSGSARLGVLGAGHLGAQPLELFRTIGPAGGAS